MKKERTEEGTAERDGGIAESGLAGEGYTEYSIHTSDEAGVYEDIRTLWSEVFGDSPEYIDAFYRHFGTDIKGYAVADPYGEAVSALTCYHCGTYGGRPVYVSYAICTREDMRGHGFGAMLTAHVRDEVVHAGGISIVSPAEQQLESFYAALDYEPYFFVDERIVISQEEDGEEFADFDEFDLDFGDAGNRETFMPEADLQSISAQHYDEQREDFLANLPHVKLSADMLSLIESETVNRCGLFVVNKGDAVCTISEAGQGRTVIAELILNPLLEEMSEDIGDEITSMIAEHFGDNEAVCRLPGGNRCQSMACGIGGAGAEADFRPYFGFPID